MHSADEQQTDGFFANGSRLGGWILPAFRLLTRPAFLAGLAALAVLIVLMACSASSGGG